jgi:UDP-N-acetyl-D-mannosaminuronate dehydrogenase
MAKDDIIVIGLGEVGTPLLELLRGNHNVIGIDIDPVTTDGECAVLHICYPFNDHFVDTTVRYIEQYRPQLTIINSTVMAGTTRAVYSRSKVPIVYSPIRGKHFKMKRDMMHYTKFIGGIDREAGLCAEAHFQSIGMKTKVVSSPETAELAKLTETTYFGLLIAWAQEIERYCDEVDADYDEAVSFFEEVPFLPPVKYVPGVIGGHCVLPNIQILLRAFESDVLNAIVRSNDMKKQRELLHSEIAVGRVS